MNRASMDRMGVVDAGFWQLENEHASLHIASVTIFDGPTPSYDEFYEAVHRKVVLLPRYRKRMKSVPLGIGAPAWADDPNFALAFHLQHPEPSSLRPVGAALREQSRVAGRVLTGIFAHSTATPHGHTGSLIGSTRCRAVLPRPQSGREVVAVSDVCLNREERPSARTSTRSRRDDMRPAFCGTATRSSAEGPER